MDNKTVEELKRQTVRSLINKGRREVEKKISTLEELKVDYVSVDSVFPNAYNPNRQSDREFELLVKSMMEDGFTTPILVQKKTNTIIDGEHRWRAAHHIGLTEIPVVYVDMTEEQARISTLRHNRARGSEDIELSLKILKDLRSLGALDWAIDSLNISDKELNAFLNDIPVPEIQANEEYSTSWVPSMSQLENDFQNDRKISSASKLIKREIKNKEELANQADTEEKRQEILITYNANSRIVNHIVAIFRGSDALIVRELLGDENCADRLFRLCIFDMEQQGIEIPKFQW